jgi:hypothetical protein
MKNKSIKFFFDKSDSNKPILMADTTSWAWITFSEHKEEEN